MIFGVFSEPFGSLRKSTGGFGNIKKIIMSFHRCYNEISTLTVNCVRIVNHFSTSLITYCKPWRNGINTVRRTQFSLIDFSKTGAETRIKMSKEELKHNKAVRGAYKGHCNQDIKRAERLMADSEAINITELRAIGERLSRRLDEIKAMDTAILKALERDEEISEETDQTLTLKDDIHYWIVKIKEFITDEYYPVSTFQTKPTPRVHINPPKLHIQQFDGNPLEWLTFWDSYSNAVHNNQELTNIDKNNELFERTDNLKRSARDFRATNDVTKL